MVNVLERLGELVDFYVGWVQHATSREDADEAALELLELESLYKAELTRPGRIIRRSSFARGSRIAANTKPNRRLVKARLNAVLSGLNRVKVIYQAKGWEF